MPTYEFRCPNGHEFEQFYKTMSTAPMELPCPECSATAARQLSGGGGLVFKGSGFYLTDYGKNAHRGEAPKAKEGDAKGVGGAEPAKTESKGESSAKADAKSESSKPDRSKPEGSKVESKSKAEAPKPPKTPTPKSE
jgi:putative FmdB family regulatory protein